MVRFYYSQLKIANFRGIKAFTLDLSPDAPTVLIGPNNAGKSTILDAIDAIDSRKIIVLVSQGLDLPPEARRLVSELQLVSAASRTNIYALQLDERISNVRQSAPEAANGPALPDSAVTAQPNVGSSRELPDIPFPAGPAGDRGPRGVESAGNLSDVAAGTGGAMFRVVTSAEAALVRIESELAGAYLIGIESRPADRDRGMHRLSVEVERPNATVRAAGRLPASEGRGLRDPKTILNALSSLIMASELRLRLATVSVRDADPSKVRLLIQAQIGTEFKEVQPVEIGFIVLDSNGRVIQRRAGSARLHPISRTLPSPLQYNGSITIPPGEYTLRFAALQGNRIGSVEHSVRARLVPNSP